MGTTLTKVRSGCSKFCFFYNAVQSFRSRKKEIKEAIENQYRHAIHVHDNVHVPVGKQQLYLRIKTNTS